MENKDKRRLFLIGDVHGNWDVISRQIHSFDIENSDIIQVGDFGIGFRDIERDFNYLHRLNNVLETLKNHLYIIRGNHDDPAFFNGNKVISFSNIKFLNDYTLLKLDAGNIFCIGGAISIDRVPRRTSIGGWFSGEEFQVMPHLIPDSTENIDILITHTAGTNCYPFGVNGIVMSFVPHDPTLLDELRVEREKVDRVFELIKQTGHKVLFHYYGHFHTSHHECVDNIERRLLNINELFEHDEIRKKVSIY